MEWGWKVYAIGVGIPIIFALIVLGISGIISNTINYLKIKKQKQEQKDALEDIDIEWNITENEIKDRKKRIIQNEIVLLASIILFFLLKIFFDGKDISSSHWELFAIVFVIAILAGLLFYFLHNQEILYIMDNQGITIKKNNKKVFFKWNDLDHFSLKFYRDENKSNSDILGESFYIKIKSYSFLSILFNRVLYVQAEPDNEEKIYSTLAKVLPEKNIIEVPSFTISRIIR